MADLHRNSSLKDFKTTALISDR